MSDKKTRIQEILNKEKATLVYTGKSKTVYNLPNGNIRLVFTDGITGGADGKEDPGANKNIGTREGQGYQNLKVSSFIFRDINVKLGIPTHQVSVDLENDMMEVEKVETLGKGLRFNYLDKETGEQKIGIAEGLEFISRNVAMGSFLKRNPEIKEGECLRKDGKPFTEVSVKHDVAEDPFFSKVYYTSRGVDSQDYDMGIAYLQDITNHLTKMFAGYGMDLMDLKVEFGKTMDGRLILSDEISAGSLRAYANGKKLSKPEIYNILAAKMPQVSIVMGSDSDLPIMKAAADKLEKLDVPFEISIMSAHRTPDEAAKYAKELEGREIKAVIAGAGLAAALPGVIKAYTSVPVIGVPLSGTSKLNGVDALHAIVQMPSGEPVATVAIDGAANAAILAAEIVGVGNPKVRNTLRNEKEKMRLGVLEKSHKLQQQGITDFLTDQQKKM